MYFRTLSLFLLFCCSNAGITNNFGDDNLSQAKLRTEYPPGKGTAQDPLAITFSAAFEGNEGCRYNAIDAFSGCPARSGAPLLPNNKPVWLGNLQSKVACNGDTQIIGDSWVGCIQYQSSPYFELNRPDDQYWVIHVNNDPSFDQCKDGPPGLSHQIYTHRSAQDSLFKMDTENVLVGGLPIRKKIRMGIYNSNFDYFCGINNNFELGNIPFISFGAQHQQGNPTPVGTLGTQFKGGRSQVNFDVQIADYIPFNCPENTYPECQGLDDGIFGVHAGIYSIVEYADTKYMLFVNLYTTGVYNDNPQPGISLWNWPIEDSFFYPGAKIASFSVGNELQANCDFDFTGYSTSKTNHNIDLTALYQCAKDIGLYPDFPDEVLPIQGVHWFIESFGPDGQLELLIEKIQMEQDDLIFKNPLE